MKRWELRETYLKRRTGEGPGGTCKCPECGHEQEHERGRPCDEVECSECGSLMARM